MKRFVCLALLTFLINGYCSSQQNEKDTIITTVAIKSGSIQLQADILPDFINLQWSKGVDDLTGYFELYRSADGIAYNIIRQFNPQSFGNEADFFSYKDEDPLRGKNYYRLIGYDKFTQEKRTVEIEAAYKNQPRKIQPTIVSRGSQLNVLNYDGEELHLWIYNSAGTPLIQKVVASSVINISSGNLSAGLYVYQLLDRKKILVSSGKFVLQ